MNTATIPQVNPFVIRQQFINRIKEKTSYSSDFDDAVAILNTVIIEEIANVINTAEKITGRGRPDIMLIDDPQSEEPNKPKLTLYNYVPTQRRWRVKHLPTGLYLGKAQQRNGIESNLSAKGTICETRPTKQQVIKSWYNGSILTDCGMIRNLTKDEIQIEPYTEAK